MDADDNDVYNKKDKFLVSTMFVPVFVIINGIFVWKNNSANSSKSCRPISIHIEKESMALTQQIYGEILEKIERINTQSVIEYLSMGPTVSLKIDAKFVMLDGKACNHIFY